MITLGFDTAADQCAAALWAGEADSGSLLSAVSEPMARGQAEALFPLLVRLLDGAGVERGQISRLAVVVGPGTFTGVRLGVAAVRGLALALGIPAVPITEFDLQHAGLTDRPSGAVAIVLRPRRGTFDVQILDPDGRPLSSPRAAAPNEVFELLGADTPTLAGPGAAELVALLDRPELQILPLPRRDVRHVARLGSIRRPVANMVPLYIRPPDAKVPAARSLRAHS